MNFSVCNTVRVGSCFVYTWHIDIKQESPPLVGFPALANRRRRVCACPLVQRRHLIGGAGLLHVLQHGMHRYLEALHLVRLHGEAQAQFHFVW